MREARPGIRVLVADDDYVIATTLSQILRLNGYETESVNSGEAAIVAAQLRSPDVLISDVVMGGISGIEAATQIAEIHPACIVLLISGQANTVDWLGQNRDAASPFEILLKPIHPAALLERLAAAIAMRRPTVTLAIQSGASAC
jgi:DNA-binding NtrC family response regulator